MNETSQLEKPVESDEFMCSCQDDGKARCEEVRVRAKEIVEQVSPCKDDIQFIDRLLYWLTGEGDIHIASDQWACVVVKPFDLKNPEAAKHYDVKEYTSMMCDSIVDGLAAAVVYHFGDNHA